jgi:hypothetical protein
VGIRSPPIIVETVQERIISLKSSRFAPISELIFFSIVLASRGA